MRKIPPETMVVAYDLSLPSEIGGTNVLFADGHVKFIKTDQFKKLGIEFKSRQKVKLPDGHEGYEVTFAKNWKPYVSSEGLRIIGQPFYGVRDKFFGAVPHVRIQWSLKNLTSKPIVVEVQYKSMPTKGEGGRTGYSIAYELGPKEEQLIDDITPIASAKHPSILFILSQALYDSEYNVIQSSSHKIVTTEPIKFPSLSKDDIVAKDDQNLNFQIRKARLEYSQSEGNVLEVEIANRTKKPLPLILHAAAGFPQKGAIGRRNDAIFNQTTTTVQSNSTSVIRLPYTVPQSGRDPYLVFTLIEPTEEWFSIDNRLDGKKNVHGSNIAGTLKQSYLNRVYWGWFNLSEAAKKNQVKILPSVPVEERAKLTSQKLSKHFLFRYRPGSYAEKHIDRAINEREEAYKMLSTLLKMELPDIVTIDLYQDMEAKGFGSGTKWTSANTVSDKQIAEVYNDSIQCDPHHELAHLFAYNFGKVPVSGGESFVEPFAVYFETENINHNIAKKSLSRKLNEGGLIVIPNQPEAPNVEFKR